MHLKAPTFVILAATASMTWTLDSQASASKNPDEDRALFLVVTHGIVIEAEKPKAPKKKVSPVKAIMGKYNEDVKALAVKHNRLLERLENFVQNENADSLAEFNAAEQLAHLKEMFLNFEKVHASDAVIGDKLREAQGLGKALSSLESEVSKGENLLRKLMKAQNRKGITASAEALLRDQHMAGKTENTNRDVKDTAKLMLEAEKQARHAKLTRPGAQGPNAVDRDEQRAAHEENMFKQRPYQGVEFVKLAKGLVPQAAMDTVVLIRNILRKSRDKAQVLAELKKFEKDINLKEVAPAYINLTKNDVDTVLQLNINNRYRVLMAFKAGIYNAPNGEEMELDLLYENIFWVCDPHK